MPVAGAIAPVGGTAPAGGTETLVAGVSAGAAPLAAAGACAVLAAWLGDATAVVAAVGGKAAAPEAPLGAAGAISTVELAAPPQAAQLNHTNPNPTKRGIDVTVSSRSPQRACLHAAGDAKQSPDELQRTAAQKR